MTWTSFLPSNVAQHPSQFVGPNLAGIIVQSLETGFLISQSIRFWSRAQNERLLVKLVVIFVSVVALFQTCIAVYNSWRILVLGFGDWGNVVDLGWVDRVQPTLNCILAAPFQALLISRCWSVMRHWVILLGMMSLLVATVVMNIYITIEVFFVYSAEMSLLINGPPRVFVTAFVLTAVLDILITGSMLRVLVRARSQVVSRQFAKSISQLHRMLWEAALPPCACAITACVFYTTMSQVNLWDVFFQSILGKLYAISLFVILNGRAELKRAPPPGATTDGFSRYIATHPEFPRFRLNLTTQLSSIIDRNTDTDLAITPTTVDEVELPYTGAKYSPCRPTDSADSLASLVDLVGKLPLLTPITTPDTGAPSLPAMSRRDSTRVQVPVRQNDALAEFESFKKKFLFANKQITKQNCSLSQKIEELNAQLSSLYVENLQLRASEIALQSQLKREKEKCHKIMSEAEAATISLLKQLGIIRQSYNVPTERPSSPKTTTSRAASTPLRKPPPRSPSLLRLAQLPSISDINEDAESSDDNNVITKMDGLSSFVSSRRRTSISRLPVPSRVSSPPPMSNISGALSKESNVSVGSSRKRKLARRPSGLISNDSERSVSPPLGSPARKAIILSEEEETEAMKDVEDIVAREEGRGVEEVVKKPKRRPRLSDEYDIFDVRNEKKERKKLKEHETGSRLKIKDITNSPRRRRVAVHTNNDSANEDQGYIAVNGMKRKSGISPLSSLSQATENIACLPDPVSSSTKNTLVEQHGTLSASENEMNVGRERRARKSVNYAEPKLNTKMRKPDVFPPPGSRPSLSGGPPASSSALTSSALTSQLGRSSTARSSPEAESEEPETRPRSVTSRRSTSSILSTKRKRLSRTSDEEDQDNRDKGETDGGEADEEFSEFSDFKSNRLKGNISESWTTVLPRRKSSATGQDSSKAASRRAQREADEIVGRRHSIAL